MFNAAKRDECHPSNCGRTGKVFNTEFNLGFLIPKGDQCDICDTFEKTPVKNQAMLISMESHKRKKEQARNHSLCVRRTIYDIVLIYKVLVGGLDINLGPHLLLCEPGITRGHSCKIVIPRCNHQSMKRSLIPRTVMLWNGMPSSMLEVSSFTAFKNRLAKYVPDPHTIRP